MPLLHGRPCTCSEWVTACVVQVTVNAVGDMLVWVTGSGFLNEACSASCRRLSDPSPASVPLLWIKVGSTVALATVVNSTYAYAIVHMSGTSVSSGQQPVAVSFDGITWESAGTVTQDYSLRPVLTETFDAPVVLRAGSEPIQAQVG